MAATYETPPGDFSREKVTTGGMWPLAPSAGSELGLPIGWSVDQRSQTMLLGKGFHSQVKSVWLWSSPAQSCIAGPYIQTFKFMNFQRCEYACQPLNNGCTVLLYLSGYYTIRLKMCFFKIVFFYVHVIFVGSIINLLQYSTVLVGYLG